MTLPLRAAAPEQMNLRTALLGPIVLAALALPPFSELAGGQSVPAYEAIRAAHRDGRTVPVEGLTLVRDAYQIELHSGAVHLLNMSGSHTVERFINEIARDVMDPQTGVSVFERRHARRLARGDSDDLAATGDYRINALGSGSDYTPFLQHLGIASLNLGYGGESGGGSYHSIFDSFDHYTRFIDPTHEYGIALAQTAGRAVLRLADAELLPWDFTAFERTVSRYADEVMELTDDMRAETDRHNRLVQDSQFKLAADPTETYVSPDGEAPVPYLNFAPLQNALVRLTESAEAHDTARGALLAGHDGLSMDQAREVDAILLPHRTRDDPSRRPTGSALVCPSDLRAGVLYGIRSEEVDPGIRTAC